MWGSTPGSLELRQTTFEGTAPGQDYVLDATTENVRLNGGGVAARVVYSEEDLPALMSGGRHLFLLLSDQLGSSTFIIDHATGELVEYATYQAYGATESNYRPERWGSFREPYKFTGKEENVEVGLAYFGARYLSLGLGRWMSPDPVTIHKLGSDANPYAYVHGRPLVAVDPWGEEPVTIGAILTVAAVGAAIGGGAAGATYVAYNRAHLGSGSWWKGLGVAVGIGAVSGAVSAGTGAWVGGAFGSPAAGAVVGGAAGGASGGVATYTAGYLGALVLGQSGEFTGIGLTDALWQGAVIGGASGLVTYGFNTQRHPTTPQGMRLKFRKIASILSRRLRNGPRLCFTIRRKSRATRWGGTFIGIGATIRSRLALPLLARTT